MRVYQLFVLCAIAIFAIVDAAADTASDEHQLTLADVNAVAEQQENAEVREPRQFGFGRRGFGRGFRGGFGGGYGGFRRPFYGGGGFRRPFFPPPPPPPFYGGPFGFYG